MRGFAQRRKRAEHWASRQGLQYGVPKHAMSRAVAQMRAMESGRRGAYIAAAASEPASSGEFWLCATGAATSFRIDVELYRSPADAAEVQFHRERSWECGTDDRSVELGSGGW